MEPASSQIAINISVYALICLLVVGSAFTLGYVTRVAHAPAAADVPAFSVFWEAWNLVDGYFYGDASDATARTRIAQSLRSPRQRIDA